MYHEESLSRVCNYEMLITSTENNSIKKNSRKMALVTIKEFLESEKTNASVKIFVLRKLTNVTYEICDATAKC